MIGSSKLNKHQVKEIKELLKEGNHTHGEIASMYGVGRSMITHINTGKRWNFNNRSFVMLDDLKDVQEVSEVKVHRMTDFEIEYITTKITRMIEENGRHLSEVKSITINFE
jgi:predicted XRE-type DNA-binding protein